MARDAGLLGVAVVLTLIAGVLLAFYEDIAAKRGLRVRGFRRPGAVALLFGAGVAGLLGGYLDDNLFVLVAGVVGALSGASVLRTGGRLSSFLVLFAGATAMVIVLGAEIPAFGVRLADIVLTAFVLTCLCGVLRELDAAGSRGWFAAVALAAATTAMFVVLDRSDDRAVGVLTAGALFGTIAAAPFAAGMLGRVGTRFAGLIIGGLAVRGAVGSPGASIAVAVGAAAVLALWVATLERPYRKRAVVVSFGAVAVAAAASIPALLTLRDVYRPLDRALDTSRGLVRANPTDDLPTATAKLTALEATFRSSERKLTRVPVQVARAVPFVGANLRATTASAASAADLSRSANQLLAQINVGAVSVNNATVQQKDLDSLANALRTVQAVIRRAQRDIEAAAGRSDLMLPPLRNGVRSLRNSLHSVNRRVTTSLDGTVAAKRLLGFEGARQYFLAVQNNAESRATGGYIANYGILRADSGRLTLSEFRRTSEFDAATDRPRVLRAPRDYTRRYSRFDVDRNWTNVNMSPDFPTVAAVMADQYRQFSGAQVDGVIAVDPIALSRLLRLTGPVRVPGWPVPIRASNAVAITLHDEYVAFANRPDTVRIDFLGNVAKRVFDQLTATGLTDLKRATSVVRQLTVSRHLQFWARDDLATSFFRDTRADGAVPPLRSDALMVTTQNAAANKIDYFLRRSVRYTASIRPAGDKLRVDATVTVRLTNNAPASGEPPYVIGPFDQRFAPGQNRMWLTVYSPLQSATATIDGQRLELDAAPEFGLNARAAFVDVPARSTRTVEVRLTGLVERSGRGYVLDVIRQPLIYSDDFTVELEGVGANGRYGRNGPLHRNVQVDLPITKR